MYDFESLALMLRESGFSSVSKSAYRKSEMDDVKKLDLSIHEELGLYIEALKG